MLSIALLKTLWKVALWSAPPAGNVDLRVDVLALSADGTTV
jgi:hypothetical protein